MPCLPPLPKATGLDALVVVVTLLDQDSRELLQQLIQDQSSEWPRNTAIVYCLDNFSQHQLERHGRQGSTSQVYKLASNAYTLGWKQITVVDALTHEQLTRKVRPGRSTNISVLYVQMETAVKDEADASPVNETTVLAKRINIATVPPALRERIVVSWGPADEDHPELQTPEYHYEKGMLLYDPLKPVYDKSFSPRNTTDDVFSARNQALSLDPPLPVELTDQITAYAEEEPDTRTMTAAPAKWLYNSRKVEIQLLVPMEPQEVADLKDKYDEGLLRDTNSCFKNTQCVVHPWIASRSANRSDLWRLFKRMCDKTNMWYNVLVFAGRPGWKKGQEVGLVYWNWGLPPVTRRLPIATAAKIWRAVYHYNSHVWEPRSRPNYEDPEFEFLLDPNARLYHNPSQFVSLERKVIMVPAFWLTQHIADDEMAAIRTKLCGTNRYASSSEERDPQMEYAFVPWASEKDGTEDDMWRLLWRYMQQNPTVWGTPPHEYGPGVENMVAIFIDQQTLSRGTVIIAEFWFDSKETDIREVVVNEEYGPFTGLAYGRCSADPATDTWANLYHGSTELDDLTYTGNFRIAYYYPDVDWEFVDTPDPDSDWSAEPEASSS
ncbi:MAG: hypothetical protein LQ352_006687 [Teloschistes flavicans]|nr:MAG: hypothetical protein LQ352_006687 [Teloschistes flavicans]